MGIFEQVRHAHGCRLWWLLPVMAALTVLPAERAAAQGAVKSVHKDWQIRCDTPPVPRPINAR